MPKKPRPKLAEVLRQNVPEALEFQVAKAAVTYERVLRIADIAKEGRDSRQAEGQCLRAWRRLRHLTSLLIDK
jgi:hypothetical protein